MQHIPPGSEQTDLFARHRGEDHGALRARPGGHGPGNLQHGNGARRIVVSAIEDRVAPHRLAHTEVVIVRSDEYHRVPEQRIGAPQQADDIHSGATLRDRHRVQCREAREQVQTLARRTIAQRARDDGDGHALKVSAVASGLEAYRAHLVRNQCRGLCRATSARASPLERIIGERGEQAPSVALGDHRGGRRAEQHGSRRRRHWRARATELRRKREECQGTE